MGIVRGKEVACWKEDNVALDRGGGMDMVRGKEAAGCKADGAAAAALATGGRGKAPASKLEEG
jgi:hypothetical protein